MESRPSPENARSDLASLDASVDSAIHGAFIESPLWYALMFALIGPGIVAIYATDGLLRVLLLGGVIAAVLLVLVHDRKRRRVRPLRRQPTRPQFLSALVLNLALMATYLVTDAAAQAFNPWVVAVVSYVTIASVLSVLGRRILAVSRASATGPNPAR